MMRSGKMKLVLPNLTSTLATGLLFNSHSLEPDTEKKESTNSDSKDSIFASSLDEC